MDDVARTLPPIGPTAVALRSGERDLLGYLDDLCDRIEQIEPRLQALVAEDNRRARIAHAAGALQARFPEPARHPPLYGVPIGIKDIFRVDGFATRAGSCLPTQLFEGVEAASVGLLKDAGALILGKTVTAEFAFFAPGPTRNPRNLDHTPGGSSSGSAAAVAAGYCPLALGTQTIGSVIRPAAYCGVVGFKPTYGRVPTVGLIFCAPSLDHVGLFTQDVPSMALAASLICADWRPVEQGAPPVLGVPDGPYLQQASPEALDAFEAQLTRIQDAGLVVKRIPILDDIAAVDHRHRRLMFGEMAQTHAAWFEDYVEQYHPATATAIREGQQISPEEMSAARDGQAALRDQLEGVMSKTGIDLWVSPAATGPAPRGLEATGNPVMNLPWTHAGMPSVTIPAGMVGGLPVGLQCVGAWMDDERVLEWAPPLASALTVHE